MCRTASQAVAAMSRRPLQAASTAQRPSQASSGHLPLLACAMNVAVAYCQQFPAGSGSSAEVKRGQQRPPAPTQSEEELIQRAREQIEEQMQQRYKEFDQVCCACLAAALHGICCAY